MVDVGCVVAVGHELMIDLACSQLLSTQQFSGWMWFALLSSLDRMIHHRGVSVRCCWHDRTGASRCYLQQL